MKMHSVSVVLRSDRRLYARKPLRFLVSNECRFLGKELMHLSHFDPNSGRHAPKEEEEKDA